MKVTILKTFVNDNGMSILKGRAIDVPQDKIPELEAKGIIEKVAKEKPKKSK